MRALVVCWDWKIQANNLKTTSFQRRYVVSTSTRRLKGTLRSILMKSGPAFMEKAYTLH